MEGWESEPIDRPRKYLVLPGCDYEILRGEIPSYFTQAAKGYFRIWVNWKLGLGLPFSGGWAEQPARVAEALELLETQHQKRQKIEQDKRQAKWRQTRSRSKSLRK